MDPHEQAVARSRAYALFARLVSKGPSERLEPWASMVDDSMAAAVASYGGNLDELLADHQHVFGISCPPFEGALLDPDGVLGRDTTLAVRDVLASVGIAQGPGGEEPDHLATELYGLALIAGAEADALEDGEVRSVERLRASARHLLDAHLCRWLPTYVSAVRRVGRAWPSALVHAIEELVLQHRSCLGDSIEADLAFELPPLGAALDDTATGLCDIARLLARPARAGLLISRDDIARLGRSHATPRGFGDRATLIENLLRSGAELGSLPSVLEELEALISASRAELGAERLGDVPRRLLAPWQVRLGETGRLLAQIREAYRNVA